MSAAKKFTRASAVHRKLRPYPPLLRMYGAKRAMWLRELSQCAQNLRRCSPPELQALGDTIQGAVWYLMAGERCGASTYHSLAEFSSAAKKVFDGIDKTLSQARSREVELFCRPIEMARLNRTEPSPRPPTPTNVISFSDARAKRKGRRP